MKKQLANSQNPTPYLSVVWAISLWLPIQIVWLVLASILVMANRLNIFEVFAFDEHIR